MPSGLDSWHWRCHSCGYEAADFEPAINQSVNHSLVNEEERERGLRCLREENFRDLLEIILRHLPNKRHRLLEVGSAHGWFVQLASQVFDVVGIEPDHTICMMAYKKGIPLRKGYFPNVLSSEERFDVIVFNDVLEHLPDVNKIIVCCFDHLNEGGLLVLNLPTSAGFFYQISKILRHLGIQGPFKRMWQMGFPSPHLHYFNIKNLKRLVCRQGFMPICDTELPSVRLKGLYSRIAHINIGKIGLSSIVFLLVAASLPFIKLFESDAIVLIARKYNQ
jgi:SAM-dependent methyltransferase